MFPILVSIGPFHLYSLSIFLVLAWGVFSFTFWRIMREYAVEEEKTFDLMFYGTIAAFVGARLVYVLFHPGEFSDGGVLKAFAIWIAPGLSFYGGLLVGISVMLAIARRRKVRMGTVLDGAAPAIAGAIIVGKIGSLLGASEVGLPSGLPLAIEYAGYSQLRHPVQMYEIGVLTLLLIGAMYFERKGARARWPYGVSGSIFFLAYALSMFILEFFKESGLYWRGLGVNQWILLGLFCESLGAIYVRSGGREFVRVLIDRLGGLYGRIS